MRGVSAASHSELLAAVNAAGASADQLGSDLFGVVAILDANPPLRRVLTDPSTEGAAKADLATSVFSAAVGAEALAAVRTAAAGRWGSGRDLGDALETAGVAAIVRSADEAGTLDALETELFEVRQLVVHEADLRAVLSDRGIAPDRKADLLRGLLESRVSGPTLTLVGQALTARSGSFERTLDAFAQIAADRRSRLLAEVRVARPLGATELERLAAALTRKYGHDVHLDVVVDPTVVGGVSVSVADDVVDGTMSSRLEAARRRIAG